MPSSLLLPLCRFFSFFFFFSPLCPFPAYNDGAQERKNIRCTKEKYFIQDDLEESTERKACQFKRSWLGDCSGLQDPHYGYSQGRPCILLRMNRVSRASQQRMGGGGGIVGFRVGDILWSFHKELNMNEWLCSTLVLVNILGFS